jgi:PilZ domain
MLDQPKVDSTVTTAIGERRQSPRLTLAKLAYIHLEPDSGAIVLNVSESGLAFHAVGPVMQTGVIRFWVSLNLNQRVEASGQLVWTDETRKTGGLRFTALSEGARQQIRKWMNQPPAPVSIAKPLAPLDPTVPAAGAQPRVLRTAAIPAAVPLESPAPAHRGVPAIPPLSHQTTSRETSNPGGSGPESPLSAFLPTVGAGEIPPERPRPFASSMYWEPPNAELTESKPKFLRGFIAGVAACLLMAIIFLGYTYRLRLGPMLASVEPKSGSDANRQIASPPTSQGPASDSSAASAPPEPLQVPARPSVPSPSPEQAPRSPTSPGSLDSSSLDVSAEPAASAEVQRSSANLDSSPRRYAAARPPQPSASIVPPDGDSGADIDVAERYLQGLDGPRNPGAAAQFLWAAIQKGSSTAEIILADLYVRGDGVPKNCAQAHVLLSAAANKGNADAQQKLQNLKGQGCF